MLQDIISISAACRDGHPYEVWNVDSLRILPVLPKLFDMISHPEVFQIAVDFNPATVQTDYLRVGEYMTLICIVYQLAGCTNHRPLSPPELEAVDPVIEREWLLKLETLDEPLKIEIEYQLRKTLRDFSKFPRLLYRRK